jgi:hypothetical protein
MWLRFAYRITLFAAVACRDPVILEAEPAVALVDEVARKTKMLNLQLNATNLSLVNVGAELWH